MARGYLIYTADRGGCSDGGEVRSLGSYAQSHPVCDLRLTFQLRIFEK